MKDRPTGGANAVNPGRELDALVAEKVMEMTHDEMWGINDYREDGTPVLMPDFPAYSEDIAAAWEVVERMRVDKWLFDFNLQAQSEAVFRRNYYRETPVYVARAETAPHAICLAALKAVGAL